MNPQIVFDVNQAGYQTWWFPALGLIFFVIGAVLALVNQARAKRGLPAIRSRAGRPVPPWFFMALSAVWMAETFLLTYPGYHRLRNALIQGRCQVLEGRIEHYHAGSGNRGDADDSFDLAGVQFQITDSPTPGFGKTQMSGGPLHEGLQVRIHAYQGEIARLEILP